MNRPGKNGFRVKAPKKKEANEVGAVLYDSYVTRY
jgi:hypothetical protein